MLYSIRGRLIEKNPTSLVVETNGITYELNVPLTTYEAVGNVSDEVTLFTVLVVREDDFQLYGFSSKDERKLFKLLVSVNGVGPRTAMSLISSASVHDVCDFIASSNSHALMSIPGIGRKTAERVILELKDRIQHAGLGESAGRQHGGEVVRAEAADALVALGYSRLEVERAIRDVLSKEPSASKSVEELVRSALKRVR